MRNSARKVSFPRRQRCNDIYAQVDAVEYRDAVLATGLAAVGYSSSSDRTSRCCPQNAQKVAADVGDGDGRLRRIGRPNKSLVPSFFGNYDTLRDCGEEKFE